MRRIAVVIVLIAALISCQPGWTESAPTCPKCKSADLMAAPPVLYAKEGPKTVKLVGSHRKLVRVLDGSNPRKRTGSFVYSPGSSLYRVKEPINADVKQMLSRVGIQLDTKQQLQPSTKTITAPRGAKLKIYKTERVKKHSYELTIMEKQTYFCKKCGSLAGTHEVPRAKMHITMTEWNYNID